MFRALPALAIVFVAGPQPASRVVNPATSTMPAGTTMCHPLTTEHDQFTQSEIGRTNVADDFVPAGDTLTTITTSGLYISLLPPDVDATPGCRQRSVDPIPDPTDKFRVVIYQDGADDSDPYTPAGLPGSFFAERIASSTGSAWGWPDEGTVVRTEDADGPNTLFYGALQLTDEDYQIDLSGDPITGLILDGRTYWIAIINDLDAYNDCAWSINHSSAGNGYAAIGTFFTYGNGSAPFDASFCLNVDITDPTTPTGACCTCSTGACVDDTVFGTCVGTDHTWFVGSDCASLISNGQCTNGPPPNDTCATA